MVFMTPITIPGTSPPMAKTKRTRWHQRSRCPVCSRFFSDVLGHLNHRQSQCSAWFEATSSSNCAPSYYSQEPENGHPSSSQLPHNHHSPSPTPSASTRVSFPGAGVTYGRAPTFLDRFNEDQYAPFRTENIYYPFSNSAEWELASFLLSSDLSMRKINELLKLKLVS